MWLGATYELSHFLRRKLVAQMLHQGWGSGGIRLGSLVTQLRLYFLVLQGNNTT